MDNINPTPDALNYDHQDTLILDKQFILTQGKTLVNGLPYMYSEGRHHVAVRLLKAWLDYEEQDEFVYLSLQELKTDRCFKVCWNLDCEGSYFMWSVADLPSIMKVRK